MEFKNRLNLNESVSMIEEVVGSVFDISVSTFKYRPHLYDYALRLAIAKYYGGYEMTGDNDIDYEVAMDIDIAAIYNTIDTDQYKGITKAINEMIEFKKNEINKQNITVVSQFDEVATALTALISNLNDKFSSLDIATLGQQLGQFDIKKLVEEYTNSERYKGNTASIIDAKNEKKSENYKQS